MQLNEIFTDKVDDSYYDKLLENYYLIIKSVRNTNQKTVAEAIHMSEPKFSAVYRLLQAYSNEKALEEALK